MDFSPTLTTLPPFPTIRTKLYQDLVLHFMFDTCGETACRENRIIFYFKDLQTFQLEL